MVDVSFHPYPDLRRLIRVAAWVSWLPILVALALTSWGGPQLQGAAVYVWTAGITIQFMVGASLLALKRSDSWKRHKVADPVDSLARMRETVSRSQTHPDEQSDIEQRVADLISKTAISDPRLEEILQAASLESQQVHSLLLRTAIVEMLLRERWEDLTDEDRQQAIHTLRQHLEAHGSRFTAHGSP
jgi:hypothetical protein